MTNIHTALGTARHVARRAARVAMSASLRRTAIIATVAFGFVISACTDRNVPTMPAVHPEPNAAVIAAFPTMTPVPLLPDVLGAYAGTHSSMAHGVNNANVIVGTSQRSRVMAGLPCTGSAAFLYNAAAAPALIDLLVPLGRSVACAGMSAALDVNNANQVVGWSLRTTAAGAETVAFLWAGAPVILASTTTHMVANAINDGGTIVGYSQDPAGVRHAVKWLAPGVVIDIHPAGVASSEAVDINNAGEIALLECGAVCVVAKMSPAGVVTPTGMIIGRDVDNLAGNPVRPLAIDNAGNLAGTMTLGGADAPFSWTAAGWGIAGAPPTQVAGLSDMSRTAGSSIVGAGGLRRAYTRRLGVATILPMPGIGAETYATDVNINGNIVGTLVIAGTPVRTRAVLWPNTTPP